MAQFRDENHTSVKVEGKIPKKISNTILVVGSKRLKYLSQRLRDDDYEKQIKANNGTNHKS